MLVDRRAAELAAASSLLPAEVTLVGDAHDQIASPSRKNFVADGKVKQSTLQFNGAGVLLTHRSKSIEIASPSDSMSFGSSPRRSFDCGLGSSINFSTQIPLGTNDVKAEAISSPITMSRNVSRSCKSIEIPLHNTPL
jgi:hypothetical protein